MTPNESSHDRRTLSELVEIYGPLGPDEAALVGRAVSLALESLHRIGRTHGGISAETVVRERGGNVVLLPAGEGALVDGPRTAESDLVAVGMLVYFLVAGTAAAGRTRLRDVRPDLPERFIQLVELLLEGAPERRITAGSLAAEWARLISGTEAKPRGTSNLRRWLPRGVVAAAVVIGVAAWFVLSPPDLGRSTAETACVPKPSNLTHWWPGEGSAIDIVGGDHGIVVGTVDYADGMVGQSFQLGSGHLRLSGAYGGSSASELSIVAWIQTQRRDGFQAILSATTTSFVHLQTTSLGGSAVYTDPVHSYEIPALTAEPTGIWRHIALTAKTGDIRIHENAVAISRIAGAFSYITKPEGALLIGAGYESERPFQGLLDEIQVYDRALADHEIQSLFRAGKAGICGAQQRLGR